MKKLFKFNFLFVAVLSLFLLSCNEQETDQISLEDETSASCGTGSVDVAHGGTVRFVDRGQNYSFTATGNYSVRSVCRRNRIVINENGRRTQDFRLNEGNTRSFNVPNGTRVEVLVRRP